MMKAVYLKPRRIRAKSTPKFALPKGDPRLNREINVRWRTEEMNVIRHDHIGVRKLLRAPLGADRDKYDGRLAQKNEDALSWMASLFELRALPRLD